MGTPCSQLSSTGWGCFLRSGVRTLSFITPHHLASDLKLPLFRDLSFRKTEFIFGAPLKPGKLKTRAPQWFALGVREQLCLNTDTLLWPQKQMDPLPEVAEPLLPSAQFCRRCQRHKPQAKAAGRLPCPGRCPPPSPETHSVSENVLVPVAETAATAPEPLVLQLWVVCRLAGRILHNHLCCN